MKKIDFAEAIKLGIPEQFPNKKKFPNSINRAPSKKHNLSSEEKILAIKNALRYFPQKNHKILIKEFTQELESFGKIYMYRFKPDYTIKARSIEEFPHKSKQAASIMLMIHNNLDNVVAQHPYELITYGGNGSVFQNWAQYLLTMKYLSEMNDSQTLVLYSGHPLGLFPSDMNAPRVVITNGMMIPNYSLPKDYNKFNALGVTQYGQMTAGSFMYIGPQGIVHGTAITILNASRLLNNNTNTTKLFVSSGLGGMSGAQPKAAKIAGLISVTAEVNKKAIEKRYDQGWIDIKTSSLTKLVKLIKDAQKNQKIIAIGFHGNIIDVWEKLYLENIFIDIGSDQTSLHNPFHGGYYPNNITFEQSNKMIKEEPVKFRKNVQNSLKRHVSIINKHVSKGTYFFDYGNAFLLESGRAKANIFNKDGHYKYPSYVQDIMGPMCFDYGFGPFRWVCATNKKEDLKKTDKIAQKVLETLLKSSPKEIQQQMIDNIEWIKAAQKNKLVVGSQSRILYANSDGRIEIAKAFNKAIKKGDIGPIIIGRDHHDVSGTDSPYRETSNIYDGSQFTSDMAIQNVIGDSFRGATWVSIHNGGGVGWGESINGGFGLLLDGSQKANKNLQNMLHWDVNNGVARRAWARNKEAVQAIEKAMKKNKFLKITLPNLVDKEMLKDL
ncbi:MAG: urocanate hydratase [Flavobacteriales bacterium]|nr:urocanate hydratase [Flavobacteriales bacterium]|tara:strand:+ start:7237 stop:9231 length:1995 start_codon:yes stop_codon:yes gene_type:complete